MLCLHDPLTLGRLPPQRLLGYHVANQTDNVDVGLSHEVPPKNPMPRSETTLIARSVMETLCAICCRGLNSILFFQVTDMVYDNSTAIQVPCPRSQFT